MAKKNKHQTASKTTQPARSAEGRKWLAPAAIVLMLSAAAVIFFYGQSRKNGAQKNAATGSRSAPVGAQTPSSAQPELARMKIAQAVKVTAELDFGGRAPTIAEAIQEIERSYAPDDGVGRTFSILDVSGEPTPDGKLLQISMRVSSEKPGMGYLRFKRTGKLLWQARIGNPGEPPAKQKNLVIYLANGADGNYVIDGERGGDSVLNIYLKNSTQLVRDVWPDGAEREVTLVYSACGCPVKVRARRVGERTVRTKDLPIIFPDDPDEVTVISRLMKW
jgi:hypothetical protein